MTTFWQRYYRARPWALRALVVAVLALLVLWPFIIDFYSYNARYYVGDVVGFAMITAILTISLNLCMGYGGLLSLMHTGLQLAGGYAVAAMAVRLGLSPWWGLVVAIVVGAVLAAATLLVSLRATYLYFALITLAANLLIMEVGRSSEWLGSDIGISNIPLPSVFGRDLSRASLADVSIFYWIVLGTLVLVWILQRNLVRSGVGRAAMAVRESPETAAALGIAPVRTKALLFAIAGGVAGLAGALYAMQKGFINPAVGALDNGLIFFVGLLIGGIATLEGPILGVAAVAAIDFVIRDYGPYRVLILGAVLLLTLLLVPRGIVGSWRGSRWGRPVLDDSGEAVRSSAVPDVVPRLEAAPGTVALAGIGLRKYFGGVKAVDGVDLEVLAGTVHGIIGPNGSGKSTTVSCLTGFLRLDGGRVEVFSRPAPTSAQAISRAGVTRVFQVPHLFEQVSVLDNVLTGMRSRERASWVESVLRLPRHRSEDRTHREEALELLAFAGLASRAQWPADALSHGQKRLLEVVRAVATRPRVLILDEPATGLTQDELAGLRALVTALRERGLAVVLIEHNVEFVMGLCERITVLDSGRVIAEGTPAEVRDDPAVLEAYLGAEPEGAS